MALASTGCDSPRYDLTMRYHVSEASGLELRVDGELARAGDSSDTTLIDIERSYDSYASARTAAPTVIEAFRDGQLAWTHVQSPAVCDLSPPSCGRVVSAVFTDCLKGDGMSGGLCSSVRCVDENGTCIDVISGPPATQRPRTAEPAR